MAKIRLTKNELKKQKDNLKRFTRYLPTLELKKKQLLMEINRIQKEIDQLDAESLKLEKEVSQWVGVFGEEVNLKEWIQIREIQKGHGNIAGIDIPVFEKIVFQDCEYDLFETPLWVDTGIRVVQKAIELRLHRDILEQQQEVVRNELRITIQRIKLFEEVKIPEAKENIRVIRISLGDLQTAEVVRGKIAKTKIERKKQRLAV